MEHRFEPGRSRRTLLLLHSEAGDENQLLPMGRTLDSEANLLSPRLEAGGEDLERMLELAGFVEATQFEYDLDPSRTVAFGYGSGASLGLALLLARPQLLGGAILVRPAPGGAPDVPPALDGLRVLVLAGQADEQVTHDQVDAVQDLLRRGGAEVEVSWQPAGHGLGPGDLAAARAWLA